MKKFSNIENLEKDEYYYSKEGYIIFTEKYHLKRGEYCYENNCKHCSDNKENKRKQND